MIDVDAMLEDLAAVDPDPRLAMMENAVFAGVARHRGKRAGRRGLMLTAVLGLTVGLGTSLASPQHARAEQMVSLNAPPANAPSMLLMGMR